LGIKNVMKVDIGDEIGSGYFRGYYVNFWTFSVRSSFFDTGIIGWLARTLSLLM